MTKLLIIKGALSDINARSGRVRSRTSPVDRSVFGSGLSRIKESSLPTRGFPGIFTGEYRRRNCTVMGLLSGRIWYRYNDTEKLPGIDLD